MRGQSRPTGRRGGSYHCEVNPQPESRADVALTVQSLGSGSSGNAYIVRTATTSLLVDCGVGIRRVASAASALGLVADRFDAVLVSHEHSDHIRSLDSVRRRKLPLLMTAGTGTAVKLRPEDYRALETGAVTVGDVTITAIATSHDAAEPCGFVIAAAGGVVAILTDMGCPNDAVAEACGRSHLLVIEANHDVDMLRLGPYPAHLKRRVGSAFGHLSNRQTGELLADALAVPERGPDTIWLAHLSATNNRPSLALETVRRIAGERLRSRTIDVLPRLSVGPVWSPGPSRATQLDLFHV